MKIFIQKNHLFLIVLAGFLFRLFFYFIGAKIYYGSEQFYIGGDTFGWVGSIQNLIDRGTYTVLLGEPQGYFFRPPGYSFFIGVFYLLSGKNLAITYQLVIGAQIILDVISISLIYKIVFRFSGNKIWSSVTAILYASYPFIIVWTPVVYAESSSVFFVLIGLSVFTNEKIKRNYFWSGLLFGTASLFRLQILFFLPAILVSALLHYRNNIYKLFRVTLPFSLAFILSYGLWPARNYFIHDRILFTQDLSSFDCWDVDYTGFMNYVFAVKTDYEPQYSQIINGGENVVWPKSAYVVPGDSEKLVRVSKMCHDCGKGFNVFIKNSGLQPAVITNENSCSKEISRLWGELKNNQVEKNPFSFFLLVPLGNLKKSLLKTELYKPSSEIVNIISTILFSYRSLMIFMGLFGLILFWRINKKFPLHLKIILFNFIFWYFWMAFVYRNMEMRYLLQVDLLLLIPASYAILFLLEKISGRKFFISK